MPDRPYRLGARAIRRPGAQHSAEGNQDVESTRATYFAGRAGMVIWFPFILEESIAALGESVQSFSRWAFTQGQGPLLGALLGEQPIAKAGADVIAGKDPADVARDTKAKVEEIQASLE